MEHNSGHSCYLALGSNLGDRLGYLESAIEALRADPNIKILRRSRLYETAPVGGPAGQGAFLNAALQARTSLSPGELLEICQETERRLGRRRRQANGPRTIDLDLLLFNQHVCRSSRLTLPHPRMHLRRFVLKPLADIAPDVIHPTLGLSVRQLLADLEPASITGQTCAHVVAAGWD